MKKIIIIIVGLFLLSVSITPVTAFEDLYNPKEALRINNHPTLVLTTVKTAI